MKIEIQDLDDLARGATFLGAGGGGDPYIGRLLAEQAIADFGMPEIIDVSELDDDSNVFCCAMLGSPPVLLEKGLRGADIDASVRKLEKWLGREAHAIIPAEIGGVNSLLPIVAATRLGLPLINADGMGRAFPETQMMTFGVYGITAAPLCLVDEHLNTVFIETPDNKRAEEFARVVATEMGGSSTVSAYPMKGRDVKAYGVHGTLEIALNIGRAIREGRKHADPTANLLRCLQETPYYDQAKVLFDGKVVDLRREMLNGWSVGHCHLEDLHGSGRRMEVTFQNEHLVAREDGRVKAIVPDLICMVDRETVEPIPAESLHYGQRLKVIGVSCAPILKTPESLLVVGPQAFGINEEFTPIDQLN